MKKGSYIGILDWGIGGLGLYQLLKKAHPESPVLYVSDAGFTPYGKVPQAALNQRVDQILRWMQQQGAAHIAIACNAASTCLPFLSWPEQQVSGIIQHGVSAVRLLRGKKHIAVIGGQRLVRSQQYRRALHKQPFHISQRIAQPLSAHIEAGRLSGEAVEKDVKKILGPIRQSEVLVLACTHYPALTPLFQYHLPNCLILDPAVHMLNWMQQHWRFPENKKPDHFFSSGPAANMRVSGKKAFGVDIQRVDALGF